MLRTIFFKEIDNSPLIVFRWMFGLLIFLESAGAIATGWVRENMVEPSFSFTFIGFEFFNEVLLGPQMYAFYAIMSVFGIMVMVGYRYRLAMVSFSIMWTITYLMQKTSYNNHYYLLVLLSWWMCLLPANRYASLDVKQGHVKPEFNMHAWHRWSLVALMAIAYIYGSIAKIYPDWLEATFIRRAFTHRYQTPWIADIFNANWFHYFISYTGILFDLLIVPALLWRRTRWLAVVASFFFHIFNSAVFHIGIFPYLSLAFLVFFFPSTSIRAFWLSSKPLRLNQTVRYPKYAGRIVVGVVFFLMINIALPLRHHWIDSNVFWTEEGHRMSWRMMLRSKSGYISYTVKNAENGDYIPVKLNDYLTEKQIRTLPTHPDMIWQFAQHLKRKFQEQDIAVEVYANAHVGLNGRAYSAFTDPSIDLAAEPWDHFRAKRWLTSFEFEKSVGEVLKEKFFSKEAT